MQKAIYHEYFSYYLHAFGIQSALPFSPFGSEEVRGEKLEVQSNILMLEGKYEVNLKVLHVRSKNCNGLSKGS